MQRYLTIIGDVHGCYLTLLELLKKVPAQDNRIVFLGDLINKGKRSFEVYRFIKESGFECILGNHEYYCLNRSRLATSQMWLAGGGRMTAQSISNYFKINDEKLIEKLLDSMGSFFATLPTHLIIPVGEHYKILLTHAGISEDVFQMYKADLQAVLKMPLEKSNSFILSRKPLAAIQGHVQIVGHRPTAYAPRVYNGNYLIDSGCVYGGQAGMGYLTALVVDLELDSPFRIITQTNID